MAWADDLKNTNLRTAVLSAIADNKISYLEMLNLLRSAATGGMTASKLSDLESTYLNIQKIFESDYLRAISYDVIYTNPANARWWGGVSTVSAATVLGDLTDTSSETTTQHLIDKWFLGVDWPVPVSGGDTATGKASTGTYSYASFNGVLFINGAKATDVNQGRLGDCYLLAALGSIANANAAYITNMFETNPNATYGIRFYNNGVATYVTVDNTLAFSSNGTLSFARGGTGSTTEMWVSLVEKGYTQLNAQFDVDLRGTAWLGENSYQAIEGGWAQAIKQVTNLNYVYYSSYYQGLPDSIKSADYYSASASTYKQTIINALTSGSIGWLGSWGATTGSNGKKEFIAGHAFMVLGYDASTDKFIIRNPWGGDGTGDYNPQFQASIETFWNSNVKGVIALSNSTISEAKYTYLIESNAQTSASAISEGQSITFTISRNASGTTSTVYFGALTGSASAADFQLGTRQSVTFAANETIKIINVATFADTVSESTESFTGALYASSTDTATISTASAYIKDVANVAYTYQIAAAAGAVSEGSPVNFTITRSGSGSVSTVYLSTLSGTAGAADYSAFSNKVVTFASYETNKTVNIDTYSDDITEGNENFSLALYTSPDAVTPSAVAVGTLKDSVATPYDYYVISNADTTGKAISEGGKVTFTIVRGGSGSASTIYVSTIGLTAGEGDFAVLKKVSVNFDASQTVATVDVNVLEDWWYETTEAFQLAVFKTASSDTVVASTVAYIKDVAADPFNYSISTTNSSAISATTEGSSITFTITRSGTGRASNIYLSTASGTALDGVDYQSVVKQALAFADYETSKTFTISTNTDSLIEGAEYFLLNLYRNYSDPTPAVYANAYIKDPAAATNYTYALTSNATTSASAVTEGTPVTFTITRSGSGTASTVYLDTNTSNETATGGSDYSSVTRKALSFADFETTKTFTVNTYQDTLTEGTEGFYLLLFKNYADAFIDYAAYTFAYIKDPAIVTSYSYTLTSNAASSGAAVTEGTPITVTINRSGTGSASTVYIETASGTATNGSDMTQIVRQTVSFAATETSKTITIDTKQDTLTEGTEFFLLNLFNNYSDTISIASTYAYIKDPVVVANYTYTLTSNAATSATAVTEGSPVTFTITRSGSGAASTIYLDSNTSNETATGGSDYADVNRQALTFSANETSKTFTVDTYQDSLIEGTEGFYLLLFKNYSDAFVDYAAYTYAYIKDPVITTNYTYTLTSNAATSATAVTEGSPVTFTITRSGSGAASTIYLDSNTSNETATGGSDYADITRQALTFSANETSKTFTVDTYQDSLSEGTEGFYLLLFKNYSDAFVDYAAYTYAYIKDPVIITNYNYTVTSNAATSSAAVVEGSPVTFTITRSGSGSSSTVYVDTVNGTATNGSDMTQVVRQAVVFAASETTKTVMIDTKSDTLTEGTEFFWLNLYKNYSDIFSTTSATAYVKDPISYSYSLTSNAATSATAVVEGSPVTFTITRSGSGNASTVYVDTMSGTATNGVDMTQATRQAVAFTASETSKTFTVNTTQDSFTEGTEFFLLNLYLNYSDTISTASSYAYMKDPATTNYTYTITSNSASSAAAIAEGSPITFTITRSGSGSVSTVYLDTHTSNETATGGVDYASVTRQALTFNASDISKTFTVDTYRDLVTEGSEFFYLLLCKNADDSFANFASYAYAFIKDYGVSSTFSEAAVSFAANAATNSSGDVSFSAQVVAANSTVASVSSAPVMSFPGHSTGEYRNDSAFAVIRSDGSVITWGNAAAGGDCSAVSSLLDGKNPVFQIYSNSSAFAAVREDGSVVTWGDPLKGGLIPSSNATQLDGAVDVKRIFSTPSAFAALRADGSVITWGSSDFGGDSTTVASLLKGDIDIVDIASNNGAFAALRSDGTIVSWGYKSFGGDSGSISQLLTANGGAVSIQPTSGAFAAVTKTGSVITWGAAGLGGDGSSVSSSIDGFVDVIKISATSSAFAALRADGSIITWGDQGLGGDGSAAIADISARGMAKSIASTSGAFAALCNDGSVVTWGLSGFGGDSSSVTTSLNGVKDVTAIYATQTAFAALRVDGSVVTWGAGSGGGDSSAVASKLDGLIDVINVFATDDAFAALRADGSVITWGNAFTGGDSSNVQSQIDGTIAVRDIYVTASSFAALRANGSVVAWGDAGGGSITASVQAALQSVAAGSSISSNEDYSSVIVGSSGADNLVGTTGDDRFRGLSGNDSIDGGTGTDTSIYQSTYSASTLIRNANGTVSISSTLDGFDTLTNVEYAQFTDRIVSLSNSAPSLISPATASTPENISVSTSVYAALASDIDEVGVLTYSISGGADASLFTINASTGAVMFKASPNFEEPADTDRNNVYTIVIQVSDGALTATKAVSITVTDVAETKAGRDFNGDGKSDILLQNANNGSCYIWELNGLSQFVASGFVGWTPGKDWVAKDTGDFNDDGKSDILLQNANDGTCYIWELNGTSQLVGNGYVGWTPGKDWVAKGTGDFNGDGKGDILLQNANDGTCYIWELNGTSQLAGNGYVGWTPGKDWVAKGTSDFNGDGKGDILLQNANDGSCYIWELDGTNPLVGNGFVGWLPGKEWAAKGTGDFNGDGKSDILLQNATDGTCYIWELNGTGPLVGNGYVGWTPGTDWHAVA